VKILLLNGPNLNLLGQREPERYGRTTLDEVVARLHAVASASGVQLDALQSNHEGVLIDAIHAAHTSGVAGIVINPGGLGHTSVSLRDALLGTAIPFVEIHVSNVFAREAFRHHSYLSDVAAGLVCGFGVEGYSLALRGLLARLGAG
jgi:3-dehydroquinate dehydratase-2